MSRSTADRRRRGLFIILGWVIFTLLAYKVATTKVDNKIYDPFEILGIKSVRIASLTGTCSSLQSLSTSMSILWYSVSDITLISRVLRKKISNLTLKSCPKYCKSSSHHFSRGVADCLHSHPDKVKLTGNDTADSVAAHFVDITKAYKSYAVIHRNRTCSNLAPGLPTRPSGKTTRNMAIRMVGRKSRWVLRSLLGSWRRTIMPGCSPFTGVCLVSASPLSWYVFFS